LLPKCTIDDRLNYDLLRSLVDLRIDRLRPHHCKYNQSQYLDILHLLIH